MIKAFKAIYSRIVNQNETEISKQRLEICKLCYYNSLNFDNYSFMQKTKLFLNRVLDTVFKSEKFEGVCLEPSCGCNIAKKVKYVSPTGESEICPLDKWPKNEYKSIYIPNGKTNK